jgi:23S rRNA (uracil1939-C5)-methyltransferase
MKITGINNLGVGYAIENGKKIFVEKSAIGDIVENGKIVSNGDNRKKVICPYYEQCGGCNLLHLSEKDYYDFKSKLSHNAEMIKIKEGTRRVANFKVKNGKIGFYKKNTQQLIKIEKCLLLTDNINNLLKKMNNF